VPIYEYRCTSCEEVFEEQRSVKNRHEAGCLECPLCGDNKDFVRVIATPTNTPFETLRDAGVFERLPGRHDYNG